ncbi:hypothetical protein M1555_02790 [Patescibacteria group bacterium]|nr:hypothetical protein [Patescibacteria group bacterium]
MKDGYILGITSIDGYTHDNSIAVVKNGRILFAASEERYSRKKHDGSFPQKAISSAVRYLRIRPSEIKTVAVGYPKRKILSVFANSYGWEILPFAFNFILRRNVLLLYDFFVGLRLWAGKSVGAGRFQHAFLEKKHIRYVDHHYAHAASAYYTSGFKTCLAIVIDAFGSDGNGRIRSGAVYACRDGKMQEVMSIPLFASLGTFYLSVTYMLGFKPGDGEGKTMGLAAYGKPEALYRSLNVFAPSFDTGVWKPGRDWIAGVIPTMPKLYHLFLFTRFGRYLSTVLKTHKKEDLAAAAQKILEEELVKLTVYLRKKYPEFSDICLSGGLFLNVKGNKKIMEVPGVKRVYVQPHAGDGGVAPGACFAVTGERYLRDAPSRPLVNCGLGESYSARQIVRTLNTYKTRIVYRRRDDIADYAAEQIVHGKVIGWFQGRAEWGPRALGFRSVLADPRKKEVKDRINEVLKSRDWFMPFAPSVLEEKGSEYFKNFRPSPFMTLTFDVPRQKAKLFPAALHIDNTARPNSVRAQNNERYYRLLNAFYKRTNLPIILNTSFNKHGLPIVNSPGDAVDHLLMGAVDELMIGDFSVTRR